MSFVGRFVKIGLKVENSNNMQHNSSILTILIVVFFRNKGKEIPQVKLN